MRSEKDAKEYCPRGCDEVPTAWPFENVVIEDLAPGSVVPDQDDYQGVAGLLRRAQGATDAAHGRELLLLLPHPMEHACGEQQHATERR